VSRNQALADVTSGFIESDPMPGAVITATLSWLTYSYPTTSNSALSIYARWNEHPASYVDVGAQGLLRVKSGNLALSKVVRVSPDSKQGAAQLS
jgi:hypothetical protein